MKLLIAFLILTVGADAGILRFALFPFHHRPAKTMRKAGHGMKKVMW